MAGIVHAVVPRNRNHNRSFLAANYDRPKPMSWRLVSGGHEDDGSIYRLDTIKESEYPIHLYIKLNETAVPVRTPTRTRQHRWEAQLVAVSPGFAGDKEIIAAIESGMGFDPLIEDELTDEQFLEAINCALIDYGVRAPLISKTGHRASGPIRGAATEAVAMKSLIGFTLDRAVNAVGDTGWDAMSGGVGSRFGNGGELPPKQLDPSTLDRNRLDAEVVLRRINKLIPGRYDASLDDSLEE